MAKFCHMLSNVHLVGVHLTSCSCSHSHALHCRHTIQKYLCQRCQRTYTALDVATFPMKDLAFQCEHCSEEGYDVPLRESYQGQDGDLVDAQQRAQRVSQAKQMQVMQFFQVAECCVSFVLQRVGCKEEHTLVMLCHTRSDSAAAEQMHHILTSCKHSLCVYAASSCSRVCP
jgi:hypothetical protein